MGCSWGKLEANETPSQGAYREVLEETGIHIPSHPPMLSLGALYIRKPDIDYVYHMFKITLDQPPAVHLSTEHIDYIWAGFNDIEKLNLMNGAGMALKILKQRTSKKTRSGASVNAYLILRRQDHVLLLLRANTGYCDGCYGLVSGHVEDGESATDAVIREAFEEAGILLSASDLKVIHVLHRQSDRFNVDIFFECRSWQGTISNQEPQKCAGLEFHPLSNLPSNTVDYVVVVLQAVEKGISYSEQGWEKTP